MICDLHNDIFVSGLSDVEIWTYFDAAFKSCGALTVAAFTSQKDFSDGTPKGDIDKIRRTFDKYAAYAKRGGWGRLAFAVEDMGFLCPDKIQNEAEFKDVESILTDFFTLPIIYAGLVWNNENAFGGGAFSGAGLTKEGKRAVEFFNSSDIKLDFAHMNTKTFYDAAERYKKPVLCSHTCFDACVSKEAAHYNIARARNLDDGQIETAVKSGGLIGLTFVATFLNGTPECTSADVIRHIDYFVQKHGCRNLAIGTDFFGTKELPSDITEYKDFDVLYEGLLKKGYSAAAVEDIFRNNFENYFGKY